MMKDFMSINNVEKFREKMKSGELCVGCDITFTDPAVSELCAEAGFDFLWIDMEHAPLSLANVEGHIMATGGTDTAPFVRLPWNDPILMKPVLELAPAAVILPNVKTPQETEAAVQACKYPPRGIRGFGPRRGHRHGAMDIQTYIKEANDQTMVIVQIEDKLAVDNLDAILATPGVDAIVLGPMDLSASLGCLGQMDHPDFLAAVDTVCKKALNTGCFLGTSCGYLAEALEFWLDKGVQWICYSSDTDSLMAASKGIVQKVKTYQNTPPTNHARQ